jgi:thiol-disulfide isomerase/thioredoxin
MSQATPAAPDPSMPAHLRAEAIEAIEQAHELQKSGDTRAAINRLERALAEISSASEFEQFKERVSLAMALAEFSVVGGNSDDAIERLAREFAVAKEAFQRIKAIGSEDEKRTAFRGLAQLKDLHTRLRLIGHPAPELQMQKWLNTEALTLANLKGQVVLLEFWATWCKPCEQLFPKIKDLHKRHSADGLRVLALTRYFMAYGGSPDAQAQELTLIREFAGKHQIEFPVGVAEDETVQSAYGATALPMLVLIDRAGIVRSFAFSPDEESFKAALADCLQ